MMSLRPSVLTDQNRGSAFQTTPDAKPDCVLSAIRQESESRSPDRPPIGGYCPIFRFGLRVWQKEHISIHSGGLPPRCEDVDAPTSGGMRAEGVETPHVRRLIAGGFHALVKRCPLRPQGYGF